MQPILLSLRLPRLLKEPLPDHERQPVRVALFVVPVVDSLYGKIRNQRVILRRNDATDARPERILERSTDDLPPEPKEIKPHPYGIEFGMDLAR